MRRQQTGGKKNSAAGEPDTFELMNDIRGLPRVRPGRAMKARVLVYSWLPSLGLWLEDRREAARINRRIMGEGKAREGGLAISFARIAAATALVLVAAFGIFGSLSVMARNSKPGDALYSVKRFREDLGLAFTWSNESRLEKSLALARTRLSELSFLLENDRLTADLIESVASDYGERTRAAEELIRSDGSLGNAGAAALELDDIRARERGLEERLAAAGPQLTLAPAGGASVLVKDTGGGGSLAAGGNSTRGRADSHGSFAFSFDNRRPGSGSRLEVYLELDGRSEILPVFPPARSGTSKVLCTVSPSPGAILIGSPQTFTATFTSADGAELAGREVVLRDLSGTTSIDGTFGGRRLQTDVRGSCSFSLRKDSLDRVTRITASIYDGSWQDLGEVLVTGGIEAPAEPQQVKATASGALEGSQDIELENGELRLSCPAGGPDQIIGSVTSLSSSATSSPLTEPSASGPTSVPGTRRSGPRLVSADRSSASYRVSFDIPSGDGMLRKEYTVTLAAGRPYAVIDCKVVPTKPSVAPLEIGALEVPENTPVQVGGRVYPPGESTTMAAFDSGSPFAAFDCPGGRVVYACPSDSPSQPAVFKLETSRLVPQLERDAGQNVSVTMMLAVTDRQTAAAVESRAARGLGQVQPQAQPADRASDGFMVLASPSPDRLRPGEQRLTISVYKRYQKLLTGGSD